MTGIVDRLTMASEGVQIVPGYAAYPKVRVGGVEQPATWMGDYTLPGDPVIVAVLSRKDAPAQFVVLGPSGPPWPREGTIDTAPPGDTVTVTADGFDGPFYATYLASYTPTVGDTVRLLWQGPDCTVLGKVGVTPAPVAPPPATEPPPAAPVRGQLSVPAVDSATWSAGYGWNTYYGSNVYQGNGSPWGGPGDNRGAWFYGNGGGQAAGATITRVQFRVPARLNGGASSSSAGLHLWLHTNPTRPAGDVNRTTGPTDILLAPGQAPAWVDLPASWGAALATGSGIGVTGNPYVGVAGRGQDPASGQLLLDWTR